MPANSPKFSPTRSAELLALADAASKGPYCVEEIFDEAKSAICLDYEVPGEGSPLMIAVTFGGEEPGDFPNVIQSERNAAFFASAPDLATELRIAVEVIKRQIPYMRHRNDAEIFCEWLKSSDYPCTCGLSEALSLIGE